MNTKLVIIVALSVVFMGISAAPAWAGKKRGIHFSEEKAAKDAQAETEAMAKSKEQWEANRAKMEANRKEWRTNLDEFKEQLSTREKLQSRRNKSVHQKSDYIVEN